MNDALLMILIVLMSLTLLVLAWAVIGLLVVARRELPKLQKQVSDLNGRVLQVLDEVIPTVQHTTLALKEAERALHEAAETIENLHIVSDNIRHKLEVADAVGAKVRRLPEKTARFLGRLMHQGFKLGGQLISSQLEKRLQPKRATVYEGARGLGVLPKQADALPDSGLGVSPKQEATASSGNVVSGTGGDARATEGRGLGVSPKQEATASSGNVVSGTGGDARATEGRGLGVSPKQDAVASGGDAAISAGSTGGDARATSENSAPFEAESVPTGEATTTPHTTPPASHTTRKEG